MLLFAVLGVQEVFLLPGRLCSGQPGWGAIVCSAHSGPRVEGLTSSSSGSVGVGRGGPSPRSRALVQPMGYLALVFSPAGPGFTSSHGLFGVGLLPWRAWLHILPLSVLIQDLINLDSL